MKNVINKLFSIKVTTILIIFILLFSASIVSINFNLLAENEDRDDAVDISIPRGSSRQTDVSETAQPNDDPFDIGVQEVMHPHLTSLNNVNITGTVSSPTDEFDWYTIRLGADFQVGDPIADNASFFIDSLTSGTGQGDIYVKLYGIYDIDQNTTIESGRELILMSIEKYEVKDNVNWNVSTFGYAYTMPFDWYYICIESGSIWGDEIDYRVGVRVRQDDPSQTEDHNKVLQPNNDPSHANNLIFAMPEPRTVDMDADTFDWYVINTPVTEESIGTNFSIKISIINSSPNEKVAGIYYLTELIVLIQYESVVDGNTELRNAAILRGSKNDLTYQDSTPYLSTNLQFSEISDATTIHVGIYVTTYGIISPETVDKKYYSENTHTHGWVEYIIKSHVGKSVIPPMISDIGVTSLRTGDKYGRTYDVFKYQLTYTDRNNDLPTIMKLTIDDMVTFDLEQSDPDDINLRDGTEYQFLADGIYLYGINGKDHTYTLHVKDSETYANRSYEITGEIFQGPVILNNIPPYPRPTAPERIYLYEDGPPKHLNLNKIFEDIDPEDDLVFKIRDTDNNWSDTYENENMIVNVLDNDNLKIIPKPDQHGNMIVELNATDLNHVVDAQTHLEITIISVNDPPQIKTPFSKIYFMGELHIPEDGENETFNMNDIFWDPVENDPLKFTFSGNNEIKINIDDNDTATISPKVNWSGTETVTFSANDGQASVSDVLVIVVDTKNDPPILNHTPLKRVYENQWCNFTISAYDPDPGDKLTYATDLLSVITGLDENKFSFDKNTGRVSFLPDYRSIAFWPYLVTVSVSDSHGATTSERVEIEILNIEDPPIPVIKKPTEYVFEPNYKITFVGDADDPDLKIPGTTSHLFFRWRSNIDGLFGEGKIIKNIILSQGLHTITLEVTDGRFSRKATITIKIVEDINLDSDNDGIPDWWEERYLLLPRDPRDATEDPDKDGWSNIWEYEHDTNPNDPLDPSKNETFKEENEGLLDSQLILIIVIILIIIFIIGLAAVLYYRNITSGEAEVAAALKAKVEAQEDAAARKREREASRRGWGKYKPKFNEKEVLCFECGKRLDVNSVVRPLAVTCDMCGEKSIVYER